MEASTSSTWLASEIAREHSTGIAVFSPSRAPEQPALFTPIYYEPNYAYPLIVWLHGPKQNEAHLNRVMPQLSLRNYIGIAPCGEAAAGDDPQAWAESHENFSVTCERVFRAIDWAANRMHVHPGRVFLAGNGSGGTMALRIALGFSECFAGAISLSGAFPTGKNSLTGIRNARKLRFFLAARRGSSEYPVKRVCEDLSLMNAAGLTVTFKQYSAWKQAQKQVYADLNRWIMHLIINGEC